MVKLKDVLEGLVKCESVRDYRNTIGTIGRAFGFDYYQWTSYPCRDVTDRSTDCDVTVLNLPSKWVDEYLEGGYAKIDPVVHTVRTSKRPVVWDCVNARVDDGCDESGICSAALAAGISGGVTIGLTSIGGEFAFMSWAQSVRTETPSRDRSRRIRDSINCLEVVSEVFHSRACHRLTREARMQRAGLVDVRLTPREREVLSWVARGKTAWEIGSILTLSPKTVEHYLCKATTKLKASNRTQAAVRAVEHALIEGEFELAVQGDRPQPWKASAGPVHGSWSSA